VTEGGGFSLRSQPAGRGEGIRSIRLTIGWFVVAVATLGLGVVGFCRAGAPLDDAVYRSLQLFALGLDEGTEVNPALQIARFAAAAVTGTALLAAAWNLLARRRALWQLRRLTGHTLLIGAGEVGERVVAGLRPRKDEEASTGIRARFRTARRGATPETDQGELVVIDLDPGALARFEYLSGVATFVGDGREPAVLERANIAAADRVIITVGAWAAASEVTEAVREAGASRGLNLTHVGDLALCHQLRLRALQDGDAKTDVFNLRENAAQSLLSGFDERLRGGGGPERIVLVGGERVAEAVLVQTCLSWLASSRSIPLKFAIVTSDAGAVDRVADRWPELRELLGSVQLIHLEAMAYAVEATLSPGSVHIVDLRDDDHALAVATAMASRPAPSECTVVGDRQMSAGIDTVTVRDLASLAADAGVLGSDSTWLLARTVHEFYRQSDLAESSQSNCPWTELDPAKQEDNRQAVLFMLRLLDVFGLRLTRPSTLDPAVHPRRLGDLAGNTIVERLAAAEHTRWRTHAAQRARFEEPWDQLDAAARSYNFDAVQRWPRLLLRLGFEVAVTPDGERLRRLIERADRFRRVGTIRARQVHRAFLWTTTRGDGMRSRSGDWLVESEADSWSISAATFARSYEPVGDGIYRRSGNVLATRLEDAFTVRSPEGGSSGVAGDWLISNDEGHVWIVPGERFSRTYVQIDG
jgi:hypothetical protein